VSRNSVSIAISVCVFFAAFAIQAENTIQPDAAAPVVTFEGQTVAVANVTRGAEVVYFAAASVPHGWYSSTLRWAQTVTDEDRDGAVTLDIGRAVPRRSIWVVVDSTNGHFTVAAPDDEPLRRNPLDKKSLRKNAKGETMLSLSTPFVDFLYIHPGKGVWTMKARDSHTTDADEQIDGVASAVLANFRPLSGDAAPKDLSPGGILVAIDLYRLTVAAERLDGQMLAEVQQ
jgi:hypothetical protein